MERKIVDGAANPDSKAVKHKYFVVDNMEEFVSKVMYEFCLPRPIKDVNSFHFSRGPAITCGSIAEFCIEPMQSCVEDRDLLLCHPGKIAFNGDISLLPSDVRDYDEEITCYRLEQYVKYPGFVRMKYVGEMKYKWGLNKYEFYRAREAAQAFAKIDQQWIEDQLRSKSKKSTQHIKGPAMCFSGAAMHDKGLNEDNVISVCCPQWPTEAKNWLYRSRNNGWPTKANLQMIANMGCHVVYAQHRDYRDDDYQWRFSFSLAEVVLLRSWTKTQQLVYHMLRFFAKRELISKDCPKEKEILCTYHLKTLMLWTCEQESPEWWNSSVIELCSKLLHKLSLWLQKRHCPNFFIPDANLFHEQFYIDIYQTVSECIQSLSSPDILSQWFLDNYLMSFLIKKILKTHKAPEGSLPDLFRKEKNFTFSNTFFNSLNSFETNFCSFALTHSLCLNKTRILEPSTDELREYLYIARRLLLKSENSIIYLTSLASMLGAANRIMFERVFCYESFLSNVMMILSRRFPSYWPKCNNFPNNYKTRFVSRYVYFLSAQNHMENMPASVSDPEFQLLSKLSMEFLRNFVTSNDAISEAMRCATYACMAAICYVTSQNESAVELCSEILTYPEHFDSERLSSRKREPLTAGCLIFIDDISNIIGYLLLRRYILDTLLDRYSEINLDLRLSPEVFAQYIMIELVRRRPRQLHPNWSRIRGKFLLDAFLIIIANRKLRDNRAPGKGCMRDYRLCVYRRSRSVSELMNHVSAFSLNEDISIRLLVECSLKKMTSLYEDTFGYFPCNTVAFYYRVLYCYRCRQYDEVMNLCEQILREPDIDPELKQYDPPNVSILPPFISYFDEDIQCLIGLQTLCLALTPFSAAGLPLHEIQNQCGIHLNLYYYSTFRFGYFLRKHFLARYLQLRCLIDNNSSVSKTLAAFSKLKCRLHFEYVVYKFLSERFLNIRLITRQISN